MEDRKGQDIGYVRVSSLYQNGDRQLEGLSLDKVFEEKISGESANRPKLNEMIDYAREGDTINIHSLDRLARNLTDLQNIVDTLGKKGCKIVFHKENLTFEKDTQNPLNKLMFQLLGSFSEFERNLIKERQAEGIKIAQKKGVKFGRRAKLKNEDYENIKQRIMNGEKKVHIAKSYNVSTQTLYTFLHKQEDRI